MGNFIDLTGQRFGMLVVESRAPNYEKFSRTHNRILKYAMWNCICDCGNTSTVLATDLKSKSQVSCGCHKSLMTSITHTTHGMTGDKEYMAWRGMLARCYNPNNDRYEIYGARGISVQTEWRDSFEAFFQHVGLAPSSKHSLDRIDSNGNYEEGNVRWALATEQAQNVRRARNHNNRFKYVYSKDCGKYRTGFRVDGVVYTAGSFNDEVSAAVAVYELYKEIKGYYPKYCDDDLKELGLVQ